MIIFGCMGSNIDLKMEEDELAARVHGVYFSDSDNSENDTSDFDEEYEALKPPTISLNGRQQDIVKIAAFKVICHKNNSLKKICSKVQANNTKPVGLASKSSKDLRINVPNGKPLQRFEAKQQKVKRKSVRECNDKQESKPASNSLISDFFPPIKSKCNENSIIKPLNKANSVTDYASAVKFNGTLVSRNVNDHTLPMINGNDSKKRINKNTKLPRKKIKAKHLTTNNSILAMNDFQNKVNQKAIK